MSALYGRTRLKIKLVVMAMDKKSGSKGMNGILSRLPSEEFSIHILKQDTFLNQDYTSFPDCDVLIAFYSDGFPLDVAIKYAQYQKAFQVNVRKLGLISPISSHLLVFSSSFKVYISKTTLSPTPSFPSL